jgi:hypothetical protein
MEDHQDIHYMSNIENNLDDKNYQVLEASISGEKNYSKDFNSFNDYLIHNQMITYKTFFNCLLKTRKLENKKHRLSIDI